MATKKNEAIITEAQMAKDVKTTGEILAAQPKVKVMIAPDPMNPMWRGCINGYDFKFPRGEMIEVPQDLATLIEQSAAMAYEQKKLEDKLVSGMAL